MDAPNTSNLDDDMLDVDFISSQSSYSSSQDIQGSALTAGNAKMLQFIDATLNKVLSAISEGLSSEIILKRVTSMERSAQGMDIVTEAASSVPAQVKHRRVTYTWPGRTLSEASRFTCLITVLVEIRGAVGKGITVTKRDIYYRQPELFKQQDTVDRLIDDIAFTCDVTRKDLRVTASPKGLFCGLSSTNEVLIVPEDPTMVSTTTISHLQWILVVEKEASFKTLVEHAFHRHPSLGRGLIVTGKGYPDLNTKQFLRHVLDTSPAPLPIFGLFDADPDGLDIYRCYRVGSKRSTQEAGSNLPEMKWLGVDIGDFLKYPSVMSEALSLTARDRIRARGMLRRRELEIADRQTNSVEDATRWRTSLQLMLMLNVKMEIQAVDKIEGGMCNWLAEKMLAS